MFLVSYPSEDGVDDHIVPILMTGLESKMTNHIAQVAAPPTTKHSRTHNIVMASMSVAVDAEESYILIAQGCR